MTGRGTESNWPSTHSYVPLLHQQPVQKKMLKFHKHMTLLDAEIVAVIGCDAYHSCRTCRSKIAETTTTNGTCTKCGMKQKLRNTSVAARLIIEDDTGIEHKVTAFNDVIKQIITDAEGHDTTKKLLAAPCMKFTISSQGTVASVMNYLTTTCIPFSFYTLYVCYAAY